MVQSQSNIGKRARARTARIWLAYAVRHLWQGIREWCGDSAYERYLCSQRLMPGERAALTREEFYVEQLNRRYSRPNRCC
jgi:uncharacterized short protein YbdD (DUF466 family)